ncbi:MAG: arginine--tRNA ligase [Pirellulales bacterium]|nr:arginine--tRNA ligase [Pirellulales bacterium]
MNILPALKSRFRSALAGLLEDRAEIEKSLDLIRRSQDAKFGDYQANVAMPLGKKLGKPPREVAANIIERLDIADLCQTPEIAGPGFINLRVKDEWLVERLTAAVRDDRLGVPQVEKPRTYVVDYSAPNVAKPMHVGHIRSTVIGDALCRTLKFLGHNAIGDNHIGDWGTQFGMILYGYKNFLDREAYRENPVEELARLYKLVRKIVDDEKTQAVVADRESTEAKVLRETAKLHAGDAENRRLWEEFLPACEDEINRVYGRLNVTFDHALGESFYEDRLAAVVEELLKKGLARESDGAICVFFKDEKGEEEKVPMIVRKQDGAFLYATTDLATIRYRMETWSPDAILYVVDHRQGMHFKHLFAAARMLGYENLELEHVSFGTVLSDDGKPFKTRSGETVGLEILLDEAVRRAGEIVAANDDAKSGGPELSPERRAEIAEIVGIGALKYADLSQNRTSDYVFSYDKMLAMNGNTATYMQYAYARVRSIFAKGNTDVEAMRVSGVKISLAHPAERALAMEILRFSEALELAVFDYRPNQLTSYLFELANRYFTFYENCHVLNAETDELRQSRLLLCDLTARTIRKGLELLGIRVVEKM